MTDDEYEKSRLMAEEGQRRPVCDLGGESGRNGLEKEKQKIIA